MLDKHPLTELQTPVEMATLLLLGLSGGFFLVGGGLLVFESVSCGPGWSGIQPSSCLCLPSTEIKDMHYFFLKI